MWFTHRKLYIILFPGLGVEVGWRLLFYSSKKNSQSKRGNRSQMVRGSRYTTRHTPTRIGIWKVFVRFGFTAKYATMARKFQWSVVVSIFFHVGMSTICYQSGATGMRPLSNWRESWLYASLAFLTSERKIMWMKYITDGRLKNLRGVQAKTNVKEAVVRQHIYDESESGLQASLNYSAEASSNCVFIWTTIKRDLVSKQPHPKHVVSTRIQINKNFICLFSGFGVPLIVYVSIPIPIVYVFILFSCCTSTS